MNRDHFILDTCEAYQSAVNIRLFQDFTAFLMRYQQDASAGNKGFREWQHMPLPLVIHAEGIPERYSFQYPGELLERYEERYGDDIRDIRAIALALGAAGDLQADRLFVGNQLTNFRAGLLSRQPGDVYLTAALYLQYEGEQFGERFKQELLEWDHTTLEELLLTISVLHEESLFPQFKPQLLRLLGEKRTVSVYQNAGLFMWQAEYVTPLLKSHRTRDMGLFRAIASLLHI